MKALLALLVMYTSLQQGMNAQVRLPVKKVHAYKQASISGVRPDNNDSRNAERSFNYWFYLEVPQHEIITVVDLWINGKRFRAANEIVKDIPLKKTIHSGAIPPDTVVLVPRTKNKVILTYPEGIINDSVVTSSRYISKMIRTSELVIGYYWKGKKYFAPVKRIFTLEPEARE